MAPTPLILLLNNTKFNDRSNAIRQVAGNSTLISVDANSQFRVGQIEAITFGVLATIFAFIALVFTALQLRQMRIDHRLYEHELLERYQCMVIPFASRSVLIFVQRMIQMLCPLRQVPTTTIMILLMRLPPHPQR
jgi:hypothetical protein